MAIEWTQIKPSKAGIYICTNGMSALGYPSVLMEVTQGDWKKAQNPNWLYAGNEPVNSTAMKWWYGPIPEIPEGK